MAIDYTKAKDYVLAQDLLFREREILIAEYHSLIDKINNMVQKEVSDKNTKEQIEGFIDNALLDASTKTNLKNELAEHITKYTKILKNITALNTEIENYCLGE